MGITVRRAKHGRRNWPERNWTVTDDYMQCGTWFDVAHTCTHVIRTYTCTNWTDAIRVANDLVRDRAIDPYLVIALSERRV